jgi:hypothetical protein
MNTRYAIPSRRFAPCRSPFPLGLRRYIRKPRLGFRCTRGRYCYKFKECPASAFDHSRYSRYRSMICTWVCKRWALAWIHAGADFLYNMHKSLWLVFRFGLEWICRMSYPASLSDYVGEPLFTIIFIPGISCSQQRRNRRANPINSAMAPQILIAYPT